jgi:ribosomal protein L11 methyltransferase
MSSVDQSWYKVDVLAESVTADAVESALSELGALGTEVDLLGKKHNPDQIVISAYFDRELSESAVREELAFWLSNFGHSDSSILSVSSTAFENRDWLAEWKKHWRPTETEKFIVAPTWEDITEPGKIVIRIEPSMAFGTGTHETTRLCLREIEKIYPGGSFLDVGTGTGILAIAVAKLTSPGTKILACDIDADSVKIAEENAELNGAAEISFYCGSISPDLPQFDMVCANLTLDVILPLLTLLIEKTGKVLVLSGILAEQRSEIVRALEVLGFTDPKVQTEGEWISVTVSKS